MTRNVLNFVSALSIALLICFGGIPSANAGTHKITKSTAAKVIWVVKAKVLAIPNGHNLPPQLWEVQVDEGNLNWKTLGYIRSAVAAPRQFAYWDVSHKNVLAKAEAYHLGLDTADPAGKPLLGFEIDKSNTGQTFKALDSHYKIVAASDPQAGDFYDFTLRSGQTDLVRIVTTPPTSQFRVCKLYLSQKNTLDERFLIMVAVFLTTLGGGN